MRVTALLQHRDQLCCLLHLGKTLAIIAIVVSGTVLSLRLSGDNSLFAGIAILLLVVLVLCDWAPRALAALYPEHVTFLSSALLKPLIKFASPAIWLQRKLDSMLAIWFAANTKPDDVHTTDHQITTSGIQSPQQLLSGVLDLAKATVEDIMIPRNELLGVDVNDDWKDIVRQLANSQHSHILLFRDSVDDVIGFIHSRELARLALKEQLTKASLLRAVRDIYFIPENTPLTIQLHKFQLSKERLGLVVDEYGDIQGLVTLEDILKEFLSSLSTEESERRNDEIRPQADGSFLVDGSVNLRDLNRDLQLSFPTTGPKTLNGLILEYLEEIPETNLGLTLATCPMEILDVQDNMIKTVRLMPKIQHDQTER